MQASETNPEWPSRLAIRGDFDQMIEYLTPRLARGQGRPDHRRIEQIAGLTLQGDPAADAFAASLAAASARRARQDLETALTRGMDAVADPSPELAALLAQVDRLPKGLDWERMRSGSRLMRRIDPVTFWAVAKVLGFYFAAYSPNAARALANNQASLRNAIKRQIETGRYFTDLLHPDGLGRFSVAGMSTVRLRVLHAHVRNFVRRKGDWNERVYGVPISAFDVLYASLDSTYLIATAAMREGYDFTPEELDDIAQFGAGMAWFMGVPEEALWHNAAEADEVAFAYLHVSAADCDPEARDLVLDSVISQPMPLFDNAVDRFADAVSVALCWRVLGPRLCRDVDPLLRAPLAARLYLPVARTSLAGLNRLRRAVPAVDRACHRAMDRFWDHMIPTLLEKHTGAREKDYASGVGHSAVNVQAAP